MMMLLIIIISADSALRGLVSPGPPYLDSGVPYSQHFQLWAPPSQIPKSAQSRDALFQFNCRIPLVRSRSELVIHCTGKARKHSLSGNSRHA